MLPGGQVNRSEKSLFFFCEYLLTSSGLCDKLKAVLCDILMTSKALAGRFCRIQLKQEEKRE
jgi:hypothetical protein